MQAFALTDKRDHVLARRRAGRRGCIARPPHRPRHSAPATAEARQRGRDRRGAEKGARPDVMIVEKTKRQKERGIRSRQRIVDQQPRPTKPGLLSPRTGRGIPHGSLAPRSSVFCVFRLLVLHYPHALRCPCIWKALIRASGGFRGGPTPIAPSFSFGRAGTNASRCRGATPWPPRWRRASPAARPEAMAGSATFSVFVAMVLLAAVVAAFRRPRVTLSCSVSRRACTAGLADAAADQPAQRLAAPQHRRYRGLCLPVARTPHA